MQQSQSSGSKVSFILTVSVLLLLPLISQANRIIDTGVVTHAYILNSIIVSPSSHHLLDIR